MSRIVQRALAGLVLVSFVAGSASGQMVRRRVVTNGPVEEIFWAPSIIVLSSVTNIPKGNLNFSIMHSFGIATNGASDLYGLDGTANIRFGLDYGLLDGLSIGVGRQKYDRLFDFRTKATVLRQTKDDRVPLELAVKGDAGIMTMPNGYTFNQRLDYLLAVLAARKFSDQLSVQVTPMWSHFNTTVVESSVGGSNLVEKNNQYALGVAARWALSQRFALVGEYIPVIANKTPGTRNTFSLGVDIDTGGHVFQLFFTTTQWFTEQHTITRNTDNFLKAKFRFGFNVNRVFGLIHYH